MPASARVPAKLRMAQEGLGHESACKSDVFQDAVMIALLLALRLLPFGCLGRLSLRRTLLRFSLALGCLGFPPLPLLRLHFRNNVRLPFPLRLPRPLNSPNHPG